MNYERRLASFRTISKLTPIEGADKIETASVDGWKVVVKKGDFLEGDTCIFIEVDSWVPLAIAPFLQKGDKVKEFNGIPGNRLRTIRLRKQLSQGLVLPISILNVPHCFVPDKSADLSALLNVQKWEKPLPAQLSGVARGNFPSFIVKTDEPRIQNVYNDFVEHGQETIAYVVTEKLNGSSMTVYWNNGTFGVCSRNLDLVESEGNAFWKVARALDLEAKMDCLARNIAIQGELIGPGVQGNPYGLTELTFKLFNVWDIDNQTYVSFTEMLSIKDTLEVPMVPWLDTSILLSLEDLLEYANGPSELANTPREGVVFRSMLDPNMSFKVISNEWLLNEE